jgi:ATP-dependent DNA helicase PIF1
MNTDMDNLKIPHNSCCYPHIMEEHNTDLEHTIGADLNEEQQTIFRECIHGESSIFCTGRGGTGKSSVTESVIRYFRNMEIEGTHQIAVTASTGIAAYLIRGITLHRFAGVGITEDNRVEMHRKATRGKSAQYWRKTDILIIDEISMISAQFFDNLSYVGQRMRNSDKPFGGMRLLMFGDFLQLPPVSKHDTRVSRVFEGNAWKEMSPKVFTLNKIMRQQDEVFTEMVSKLRLGKCTNDVCDYFQSLSRDIEYYDGIEPVRLYSLRKTTDEYNLSKLDQITAQARTYESIDKGDQRSLKQCPAPETLKLKAGCQVMLTRNLGKSAVNGSIGTLIGFKYVSESRSSQPLVKFVNHDGEPFTMSVPRCVWETVAPNGSVMSSRNQVPLILAWAITIHKSQGQTIPRLHVDLNRVFECGQAYVALSRCTDPSSLQVVGFSKDIVKVDPACLNYYEPVTEYPATSVARSTQERWDNNQADTLMMLGHLSIQETTALTQETSSSSQQDSEKS